MTVIYLPAAFVAAFFAMPFFHFDESSGQVVLGGRFWLYWIITLPLSIVTILAWLVFTKWQNRAIKIESDQADASLGGEDKGGGEESEKV